VAKPALERNSGRILDRLKREGWVAVSTRGSHVKLKRKESPHHIVVPHPKKDLPTGTARNIAKIAGWI
jgi:predicted RNA binding protein YcfA (HicA-like mRNA interferase family)